MKRVIFALLVIAAGSIPAIAKYSGGTGDPNTPYQIANVADLMTLANDANDYNKCFIMTANIDLDPCLPGNQIFTKAIINEANFTGVFDGSGHQINNMTIDSNQGNLGLFKQIGIGGQLKNLRIENICITGGAHIWAYIGGLASYNHGTINNCHTSGKFTGGPNSEQWIGGLAGINDGNILNCTSAVSINFSIGSEVLGGLVGANGGNITSCFTAGDINAGSDLGGMVGVNFGQINNSFSSANVTGSSSVGGLVGDNKGSISNSYSKGSIFAQHYIGGLSGLNESGVIANCYSTAVVSGGTGSFYFGGLVGYNLKGTIDNCYSIGNVAGQTGSHDFGGLVGYRYLGSINHSYFLITSGPNNGQGTPLMDTQMKQQSSFAGWDFVWETTNGPNDIWAICEGVSYPKLAWQFLAGDSDNDKDVDFTDFAPMGLKWMQTDTNLYCGGTDLTGDQWVDLDDLDALVENWLQGL